MGHTGEVLASTPLQHTVTIDTRDRSRARRTPIVTVENTVVRIVLPEGFGESDWKRLKDEAQEEQGEEEAVDSDDEQDLGDDRNRGYERSNQYDEGKDEFGEEEDDGQEEADADSDGEDNDNDEASDDEDGENNQQSFLGKRMTARQLSMAKRAERPELSQLEESAENFDQMIE